MTWLLVFTIYDKEHLFPLYEIPDDFFDWVNEEGKFDDPEEGVPYFLGKKLPKDFYPESIDSARIYQDIRYKMSDSFFGRCLEEHKGLVEKRKEEERQKAEQAEMRRIHHLEQLQEKWRKEKEAWDQKCATTKGLQCEECHRNLWCDQDDYVRRGGERKLIRFCHECSKNQTIQNGKVVRCSNDGCETPVYRNQYTGIPYDICSRCHRRPPGRR